MNVHIHRGGQQHGPYPLEQVKAWLASGELSASVMSSVDGGASWIPVHCIPDVRNDDALAPTIRTATSTNLELETKIIEETLKEIEQLLSNTDPAARLNIQNRVQWKLRILHKQGLFSKGGIPKLDRSEGIRGGVL